MKKILIKLFILTLIILLIDRGVTYIFTKVIFEKTISGESGGTINYLIKKKKDKDFYVLGSSRAKFHIDPSLLTNLYNGNGYNAGITGTGGLIYNDMLLKLLDGKGIKPKEILLQVDLYHDETMETELSQLYPFIGQSDSLRAFVNKNASYAEKFKLLFHSYRFNGKFPSILSNYAKRKSVKDYNGFEGLKGKFDTTTFQAKEDLGKKHPFGQVKLNALLDIIQTCKANHIKLGIVFSPSYLNSLFIPEIHAMLITLLHQNGVDDIYDFADVNTIPSLQPYSMWKDPAHLNKEGAVLFSQILNDSIGVRK